MFRVEINTIQDGWIEVNKFDDKNHAEQLAWVLNRSGIPTRVPPPGALGSVSLVETDTRAK